VILKNVKIIGGFEGDSEKTSRGNIFCLGDVLKGTKKQQYKINFLMNKNNYWFLRCA